MTITHPGSYEELRSELDAIAQRGDFQKLAELLSGRGLPLLGGNPTPADIIDQALSLPPYGGTAPEKLASLLGVVARDMAENADPRLLDRGAARSLLQLAGRLPRNSSLFDGLMSIWNRLAEDLQHAEDQSIRMLRRALAAQQTDDRLEPFWMSRLAELPQRPDRELQGSVRSRLLAAWDALLEIPPLPEVLAQGFEESADRLASGLRRFFESLDQFPEQAPLTTFALREMAIRYPHSSEFWVATFKPYFPNFPQGLKRLLAETWPGLASKPKLSLRLVSKVQRQTHRESTWPSPYSDKIPIAASRKQRDKVQIFYVGNLPPNILGSEVRKQLSKYGVVESVKMAAVRGPRRLSVIASVKMISGARQAIEALNQSKLFGRRIQVSEEKPEMIGRRALKKQVRLGDRILAPVGRGTHEPTK